MQKPSRRLGPVLRASSQTGPRPFQQQDLSPPPELPLPRTLPELARRSPSVSSEGGSEQAALKRLIVPGVDSIGPSSTPQATTDAADAPTNLHPEQEGNASHSILEAGNDSADASSPALDDRDEVIGDSQERPRSRRDGSVRHDSGKTDQKHRPEQSLSSGSRAETAQEQLQGGQRSIRGAAGASSTAAGRESKQFQQRLGNFVGRSDGADRQDKSNSMSSTGGKPLSHNTQDPMKRQERPKGHKGPPESRAPRSREGTS